MSVDQTSFQQVLDGIPERDATALSTQHDITDFSTLLAKKSEFQQRQLKDVCPNVQMALEAICDYVESLDPSSTFTWEGFENFCDYTDKSGDATFEDLSEAIKKKAISKENPDPDGYSLTAEERQQMEKDVEDDPLTLKIRGFSARALQFEFDEYNNKKRMEDASEKTEVAFNGTVYYVKKCYFFQQSNGELVTVGILKFTKNEKKAICALIVPFKETIMGPRLEEEPPIGVPATYEEDLSDLPTHVCVRVKPSSVPILPLSALTPCAEPPVLPELFHEPQQKGERPHNFGFVYDNDGTNRGEERVEIQFFDFFAGSGGFHQGIMQEPKFKGVGAVEYWDTACKTFSKNNPETPVHCMKVEDFLEEHGPSTKCDAFVFSSPCQSFSGINPYVDHNSEKDLYRKGLSLKFVDAMQILDAKVGVLENVEGMWRRTNVYFLKKILLDLLRTGHHFRVRLFNSAAFGDPQARPRLCILAAKKFVEIPTVLETHGPGLHPYVTTGTAFKALEKTLEKVRKNPELPPIPNMQGANMSKPDDETEILNLDQPAGTICCGGRAWHPTKERTILVREAAAIQSYPAGYEFVGSLTDQYKQVGNAVPGRMARAIARAIYESLRYVYDEEEEMSESNTTGGDEANAVVPMDAEMEAEEEVVKSGVGGMEAEDKDAVESDVVDESTDTHCVDSPASAAV